MEKNIFYIIKNNRTNEVWSGYKWKKGTWQKGMLYKRADTVHQKLADLSGMGYDCRIVQITVIIEEY